MITRRIPLRLTPFSILGVLLAAAGCGTIAIDIRTEIISQQEIKQHIEYVISGPIAALFIEDGEFSPDDGATLADMAALEAAGWDLEIDVIQVEGEDALRMRLSQTFTGVDAAQQFKLASEALAEENSSSSMIPLLDVTETESEIIYELRMSVATEDPAESSGTSEDPLASDEALPTVGPMIINGTPFAGLPDFSDTGSASGDFTGFDQSDGFELEVSDGFQDFADSMAESIEEFMTVKWTVEMPGNVSESNATSSGDGRLNWDLNLAEVTAESDELFARSVVSKNAGSCNR